MTAAAAANLRLWESKSHEKSIIHCICVSEKKNRIRKAILYYVCVSEKISRIRKRSRR